MITQNQYMLFVRVGEGVGYPGLWVDHDCAMDGATEPRDVGMPEERALLLDQGKLVGERLAGLDRALGEVRWSIRPTRQPLPDPMPMTTQHDGVLISFVRATNYDAHERTP